VLALGVCIIAGSIAIIIAAEWLRRSGCTLPKV
jgi:hypothetical protein